MEIAMLSPDAYHHSPHLAPNSFVSNPPASNDADLDELEVGSNFSWSSVTSSTAQPDMPSPTGSPNPNTSHVHVKEGIEVEEPIRKHSTHFWEYITLRVEGITFQLPKYRFVEESDEFMNMVAGEGYEPGSPIKLDGVLLSDFESFLKAFLPRSSAMYDDKPTLSKEEWISVLKLSSQWLFNDLRKLAIDHLSAIQMDGIERICLAKEYRVYDWLLEGYVQVVDRLTNLDPWVLYLPGVLSTEEGMKIGMDVALELSGIVILQMRRKSLGLSISAVESDIIVTFSEEFEALREGGLRFLTKKEIEARREADERMALATKSLPKRKPKGKKQGQKGGSKPEDVHRMSALMLPERLLQGGIDIALEGVTVDAMAADSDQARVMELQRAGLQEKERVDREEKERVEREKKEREEIEEMIAQS